MTIGRTDFLSCALMLIFLAHCGSAARQHTPAPGPEPVAARQERRTLEDLSWLVGSWEHRDDQGRTTAEHWSAPHPELLIGWSQTMAGEEMVSFEHLEILHFGAEVAYWASPRGQPTTSFGLVEVEGQRAVFENARHDFPQRIVYWRVGDELHARIEGTVDGEARSAEWRFQRQPTDPPRDGQFSDREIVKSVVVEAPPAEVFRRWTTDEGARTFFAPDAHIEPAPGGAYQLSFDPEAAEGDRGSEGCIIIELQEDRRIAFTWSFPPSLPTIRQGRTLVTVDLEPVEGGRTRVNLRQVGFRVGPVWDEGSAYFDHAWTLVLDRLARSFTEGPMEWGGSYAGQSRR